MVSKCEQIAAAIIVIRFLSKKQKSREVRGNKDGFKEANCVVHNMMHYPKSLGWKTLHSWDIFLRMIADDFEELCIRIAPIVLKMDTNKH